MALPGELVAVFCRRRTLDAGWHHGPSKALSTPGFGVWAKIHKAKFDVEGVGATLGSCLLIKYCYSHVLLHNKYTKLQVVVNLRQKTFCWWFGRSGIWVGISRWFFYSMKGWQRWRWSSPGRSAALQSLRMASCTRSFRAHVPGQGWLKNWCSRSVISLYGDGRVARHCSLWLRTPGANEAEATWSFIIQPQMLPRVISTMHW